jgi:hypothetical protein
MPGIKKQFDLDALVAEFESVKLEKETNGAGKTLFSCSLVTYQPKYRRGFGVSAHNFAEAAAKARTRYEQGEE